MPRFGTLAKGEEVEQENIKKAIKAFYRIRNIPYHIPLDKSDKCNDCEGKNKKLGLKLKKLGYKVKSRVGLSKWKDLNLPAEILRVLHEDESSHFFLEVKPLSLNKWVFIDATWNLKL